MKNLIIIILLSVTMLFSAGLNIEAEALRGLKNPEIYTGIKSRAKNEWAGNPSMIIYTINKQCKAFFEMGKLMDSPQYQQDLMKQAVLEWKGNFSMIVYTYKRQFKARMALDF